MNQFAQTLNQALKSINNFLTSDSLSLTPAVVHEAFPNLLIERLYYSEGRQHPFHPLHGSYADLCRS
jgi:hypothetical protein